MSMLFRSLILVLSISPLCIAQEPVAIVNANWHRTVMRAQSGPAAPSGPVRAVIAANKTFERKAREQQSPGGIDPNEMTIDGRSAALEKAVQESRTPRADDANGYLYTANVRNDSGKTVEIIFWEYRFTEAARPENVFRRQFLCAMKLKNGQNKELSVFSLLGPSDIVDAESPAKPDAEKFREEAIVNRTVREFDAVVQRGTWKYADVKKDVERVTATPWGKEICRSL
jgi:hypothetical protein